MTHRFESALTVRRTATTAAMAAMATLALARLVAVQPEPRLALQLEDYAALPITADNYLRSLRGQ